MEPLSSAAGAPLHWVQPKAMERLFELRSETALFADLQFQTAFGTLATARTADGNWSFKRVGFLNPRVTVRLPGAEADLAIYQPKFWGDGLLTFTNGPAFHWKSVNLWGTNWGFADAAEKMLYILKPGADKPKLSDIFKTQALLDIDPGVYYAPHLPLLVTLGWYLLVLQQDDTTATTAATTTFMG